MARSIYYPAANRTAQWFGPANYTMPGIDKLLLHTTETSGWPGYGGGASAPTLTYHGEKHQWRQHFPLNGSARALRDPDGTPVRENRDSVVQVEIICYCEPGKHPNVTDLDNQALDDLGEFAAFLHTEWGTPLTAASVWLPFPESYGPSAARMTSAEYDAFRGILGHQHASGNSHGDPGALNVSRILATARRLTTSVPTPDAPEEDMPLTTDDADLVISRLLPRLLGHEASNGKTLNDLLVTTYTRSGLSNQQGTAIQNMLKALNPQLDAMHAVLTDEDAQTDRLEAAILALGNPDALADRIADSVIAALPDSESIDKATVVAGVREALGSLDEETPA